MVRTALYLVEQLTASYTRRYHLNEEWEDYIYSIGSEALVEAALRYDPSRGTAFDMFAWKRVSGAMRRALGRDSERHAAASRMLHKLMAHGAEPERLLDRPDEHVTEHIAAHLGDAAAQWVLFLIGPMRCAPGEERVVARETYANALRRLDEGMRTLAPPEAELIEMRYWQDRSWPAVARAAGMSESTAKRRDGEILAKLRSYLMTCGIREAPALEGRPECA